MQSSIEFDSGKQTSTRTHGFDYHYNRLNPSQKRAVDQIQGAVMVIAGPGTGKTQILAVRIAKILADTDAQAHNILCLTFTDSATIAMRRRLVQIIGPAAHQIHIYTFHGFCNQVIQENLDIFGNYRQLEPLTDLERVDVYHKIISDLPNDHVLKRLKGDPTFEHKRLDNLFQMMKKENLNAELMYQRIDDYLDRRQEYKEGDDLFYHRKYKEFNKGDIKPKKWEELQKRMSDLRAGVALYETYLKIMDDLGRYDYQDMILWVLRAFQADEALLASYQERYLYFLVDEFQDTNGAQKAILDQLISYWSDEDPNVFVVGDDDQAIYKFQGANISNVKDFRKDYKPVTIVLEQNYRSSQRILDTSKQLIEGNQERIINDDPELTKDLVAAREDVKDSTIDPNIISYTNNIQEQTAIAKQLMSDHKEGIDLSKTAVIYRKHAQVDKLVEVLEKKGVPLNIKRKVNILKESLTHNILKILRYVHAEHHKPNSADELLYEMMHYRFFDIHNNDIAKISNHCNRHHNTDKKPVLECISDKDILESLGIKQIDQVLYLGECIDSWVKDVSTVTLQVLFENIINDGHILQYIIGLPEKTWLLQILSTLFDLIKNEMAKAPDIGLKEFLSMISKMEDNKIELSLNKIVHAKSGVNFLTAHSSKGLEFERVIIPDATKNIWDKNVRNIYQFKYPDNVNEDVETNTEDERRLLYVAMTRAQLELDISYGMQKENGKEQNRSQFVDEIIAHTDLVSQPKEVAEDAVNEFQYYTLLKAQKEVKLIDHDLIDKVLDGYKLSVTGLNKYLRCPRTFYFETVLRIPTARTKYMGFGRAIHRALEDYYQLHNEAKPADLEQLLKSFHRGMLSHRSHFTDEDFKLMTAYGEQILPLYHKERLAMRPEGVKYGLEVKVDHAEYQGVPIKGVLDRVDIGKDGQVDVTDYKTGNIFPPKNKKKLKAPKAGDHDDVGGDYWRQIVFYKLLLDSDKRNNWDMTSGWMDFIEPEKDTNKLFRQKIVVTPQDIDIVGQQIKSTWDSIQNHEFSVGCQDEHCTWCNFVKNDFIFTGENVEDEDDIQEG
jgi:DNA helicase-2/ATP-dependent DNA helicase PcrA